MATWGAISVAIVALGVSMLFLASGVEALACSECDHVLTYPNSGTYYVLNNTDLKLAPGAKVCWSANKTYALGLSLDSFVGTEAAPFLFTNCDGPALIQPNNFQHAISFPGSKYFRLTGSGVDGIDRGLTIRLSSFGVLLAGGANYFEIDHLNIEDNKGHTAISCKSDPTSDNGAWVASKFTMYNPRIHHNKITRAGTEGFYIGYNNHQASEAHDIVGLRVYENLIEDSGYDGIQVGAAISDAMVWNNTVLRAGQSSDDESLGNSQCGIFINTGFKGKIFNNYIEKTVGDGIRYHGNGDTEIFNNVINDPGGVGIGAAITSARKQVGTYLRVNHNTIADANGRGISLYLTITPAWDNTAKNNLVTGVFEASWACVTVSANTNVSNNICNTTIMPEMLLNADLTPKATSPLVNQGVLTGLEYDKDCKARDSQPDIGAYEIASTVVSESICSIGKAVAASPPPPPATTGGSLTGSASALAPLSLTILSLVVAYFLSH